jgi:F0F1-type ATP synthase alpha subunit
MLIIDQLGNVTKTARAMLKRLPNDISAWLQTPFYEINERQCFSSSGLFVSRTLIAVNTFAIVAESLGEKLQ